MWFPFIIIIIVKKYGKVITPHFSVTCLTVIGKVFTPVSSRVPTLIVNITYTVSFPS
jgi:hypothetical protein